MSILQAIHINSPLPEYNENLLNPLSTMDTNLVWNVTSGSATVTNSTDEHFQGVKSLKIVNFDGLSVDFNTVSELGCTVEQDGEYIFSYRNMFDTPYGDDPYFGVNIFINGLPVYSLGSIFIENDRPNTWNCFYQNFYLSAGDVVSYTFTYSPGGAPGTIWVDGFKFERDNLGFGFPTLYSMPKDHCCGDEKILLAETQWDVPDIGAQVIANGASINLFTLINNATHKNTTNTDLFDELDIVSNSIVTTYRGCKTIHTIRLSLNIVAGSDQFYQLQIRRTIDNSIVYRSQLQRNSDETIQTLEMTTRTLSNIDPFTIDGFYLAFVNNSGASATIDDALSLVIISKYQKSKSQ